MPGWIARARASRGITHTGGRVGLGYESGFLGAVYLSLKELGHHGAIFGAPGTGKTTCLSLLVQGHAGYGPSIVVDGKGSLALQRAIYAAGGLVWTIGGRLKLDLLDPDPTVLAEQLTEATRLEGTAEVYSAAAARSLQWIGHLLAWQDQRPTLEAVEALLSKGHLTKALEQIQHRPRVRTWLDQLGDMGETEISGVRTALMRITRMIDSEAGPSLGSGLDAVRLEDVVQGRTTLLLSLDSRRYPGLASLLGGWILIALQRACAFVPKGTSCLMVVDEVGAFGRQARHIEPLLARARDAGVGVVMAAHGPSQLDAAVHNLASQSLQETAWQIVLGQGDPDDADRLSRLFPLKTGERVTLAKHASGVPTVTRDTLMWLATGDCAFRVLPRAGVLDGRWGLARIAMPRVVDLPVRLALPAPATEGLIGLTEGAGADTEESTEEPRAPKPTEEEIKALVYAQVRLHDGYRIWGGTVDPKDGYPRLWVKWAGSPTKYKGFWLPAVHRRICAWEQGAIPRGWEVDHECGLKLCLDHLKAKPKVDNRANQTARQRGEAPTGHAGMPAPEPIPPNSAEWRARG